MVQGGIEDEGTGQGMAGRLRETSMNSRPPRVRRKVGSQSTGVCGHEERDNDEGAISVDQGQVGEASGAAARAEMLDTIWCMP
jgi:hypothetical protein